MKHLEGGRSSFRRDRRPISPHHLLHLDREKCEKLAPSDVAVESKRPAPFFAPLFCSWVGCVTIATSRVVGANGFRCVASRKLTSAGKATIAARQSTCVSDFRPSRFRQPFRQPASRCWTSWRTSLPRLVRASSCWERAMSWSRRWSLQGVGGHAVEGRLHTSGAESGCVASTADVRADQNRLAEYAIEKSDGMDERETGQDSSRQTPSRRKNPQNSGTKIGYKTSAPRDIVLTGPVGVPIKWIEID